ncbi:hypothetical protein BROUX41_000379 [Berkeleyomyces rouxiae]
MTTRILTGMLPELEDLRVDEPAPAATVAIGERAEGVDEATRDELAPELDAIVRNELATKPEVVDNSVGFCDVNIAGDEVDVAEPEAPEIESACTLPEIVPVPVAKEVPIGARILADADADFKVTDSNVRLGVG